jgi:hypothetical protein
MIGVSNRSMPPLATTSSKSSKNDTDDARRSSPAKSRSTLGRPRRARQKRSPAGAGRSGASHLPFGVFGTTLGIVFLCQRGKQVQNERINVRSKLSDQERHAVPP